MSRINKFPLDVMLINVAGEGDLHNMADFPYGMALITGYLREKGFRTKMLQYPTWKKDEYEKQILNNPCYLYGFQVNFENYPDIQALVTRIKSHNPSGVIVLGGPFVACFYEEILKNDPNIDAVVLGEGESTTAELIELLKNGCASWTSTLGLARRDDMGNIIVNPSRPAIEDLNVMPFAARDGIAEGIYDFEGKYLHDVRITTSRGCTSNCKFCGVNIGVKLQKARRWRGRHPTNVVDEIQELVEKYNVKLINLQDSSFDDPGKQGMARNKAFCEEILKRNLEISMKAYMRAHRIYDDPDSIELYKLYKEAGIDVTIVGAEAGSDYELKIYGKDAKLADNYRSIKVLNDLDLFFVHVGFIMFGPRSTLSTLRQNIKFLFENHLLYWYPSFSNILLLLPGSALYESIKNEGKLLPRKDFWKIPDYEFSSPEISKLAMHYKYLKTIYAHINVGTPLVITVQNIISRLKNKMNERVAIECRSEIETFKNVFYRNKNILNDLAYNGFVDNLERLSKDGLNANLMISSEHFLGKNWGTAIYEIQEAYKMLTDTVQSKGFGLGGLVFEAELVKSERLTSNTEYLKHNENVN